MDIWRSTNQPWQQGEGDQISSARTLLRGDLGSIDRYLARGHAVEDGAGGKRSSCLEPCLQSDLSLDPISLGIGSIDSFSQLLPFKKGPFHLQEETGVPITPALFFGAFELWPRDRIFSATGKVRSLLL